MQSWGGKGREAADASFARFVYVTGQSFDVGKNKFFLDMVEQIRLQPQWQAKGRVPLTTTDLDKQYKAVDSLSKIKIEKREEELGKTLQTDGWSNKHGEPQINVIISTAGLERFETSVECLGQNKDMMFLANLVSPHIDRNTDLVVSDGACAGMLKILEKKFPWVTGGKCFAHAVDLLLKDLSKLSFVSDIIDRNNEVVKFIRNHHATLGIFQDKTKLHLIKLNATRFATNFISCSRTLQVSPLKNFANGARLVEYLRTASTTIRKTRREVRTELLGVEDGIGSFYFEINFFVKMMEPLVQLLRMADGITPCASKFFHGLRMIPDRWRIVSEEQATETGAQPGEGWKDPVVLGRLEEMKVVWTARRKYARNPLISAAYALDPEHHNINMTRVDGGQVLFDLSIMYRRILIDHGDDSEAAISKAADEVDGEPVARAMAQFAVWRTGSWQGAVFFPVAKTMQPHEWWSVYGEAGGDMAELTRVAMRVLSKVPASAGAERNWSLFGDITGGRHGRMSTATATKVAFVRANLKLHNSDFQRRPIIAWDPESVESDGQLGSGDDGNWSDSSFGDGDSDSEDGTEL